jgi:hypothetical protein
MASLREQLQPDEEMIYVAHPTRIMVNASLIGIVLLGILAIALWQILPEIYMLVIIGVAALPLIFTAVQKSIVISSNKFILTNRRVLKATGILSKQSSSAYLDKINNVEHRQTLWGRMLGYGDVEIDTASETGTTTFRAIANPLGFQRAILQAAEPYRGPRGSAAPLLAASGADRLRELKQLLADGLISQAEYDETRKKLLKAL